MTARTPFLSALVFFIVFIPSCLTAADWYVDASVSQSGDGKSWQTAFKSIQGGINAASGGDNVTVAQGIYMECIEFRGKDIVLSSTDPFDSQVVANTIISSCEWWTPALTFSGSESESCVFTGFTISSFPPARAPGIVGGTREGAKTHATIENNVIIGCEGGNAALDYCDGTIRNNIIAGNLDGGLEDCDGQILQNLIVGNMSNYGGGLANCDGIIKGNLIAANWGNFEGGGGLYGCNGTIEGNTIILNSAIVFGGGLHACNGLVQNNTLVGNNADEYGGGLSHCKGIIRNNILHANSAGLAGGALYGCAGAIENNTIVGNSAPTGAGICLTFGTIRNCIVWGNKASHGAQVFASSEPTYSCIEGWTTGGEGNVNLDPLLVDLDGPDDDPLSYEDNDYHLAPASPCIDAGINATWMVEALDIDGRPRIYNGIVDIGADEKNSWVFKIVRVETTPASGTTLTWDSRPSQSYTVWCCVDLLSGPWTEEVFVPSDGTITSWTDNSSAGRMKFYKIEMK